MLRLKLPTRDGRYTCRQLQAGDESDGSLNRDISIRKNFLCSHVFMKGGVSREEVDGTGAKEMKKSK